MDEQTAMEVFKAARAVHSVAHKEYMNFRRKLKTIPKENLSIEQYREFLRLKDAYSEACKARNRAEIEFQAARAGRVLGAYEDGVKIFDKISAATQIRATEIAKLEEKQEKQRQLYGTHGDPSFERMKEAALRGLGLLPPVEEKKDGLS